MFQSSMDAVPYSQYDSIQTKRLQLRFLKPADRTAILSLRQNEQVLAFLDIPVMADLDAADHFIKNKKEGIVANKFLFWGICKKGADQVIGTICLWNFSEAPLKADIGYELHPDYQKQGIMQEAITSVLSLGFETLGLQMIEACTNQNNLSSIRLLEKNNFSFVKVLTADEKLAAEQDSELVIYRNCLKKQVL